MAVNGIQGTHVETDILVVGAGAGGLVAALSAKRAAPPGTRVTIVDSCVHIRDKPDGCLGKPSVCRANHLSLHVVQLVL